MSASQANDTEGKKTHCKFNQLFSDEIKSSGRLYNGFLKLKTGMLNMQPKQIADAFSEAYKSSPLSIDSLIVALRKFKFGMLKGKKS